MQGDIKVLPEFLKSQRGQMMISHDGFLYSRDTATRFRCKEYQNLRCPGKLYLKAEDDSRIRSLIGHNHQGNDTMTKLAKFKSDLKEATRKNRSLATIKILSEQMTALDSSIDAEAPQVRSLCRTIQRVKREEFPPEPKDASSLVMREVDKQTKSGELFLFYDSKMDRGSGADKRMLCFASAEGLRILQRSKSWYADGTFRITPKIFAQTYVVLASFLGSVVPVAYALLPDKHTDTYVTFLSKLLDAMENLTAKLPEVEVISLDFESAMINAVGTCLPGCRISLCWFHYAQSILRKVQSSGMTMEHRSNKTFNEEVRMMTGLALVPLEHMKEACNALSESFSDNAKKIFEYVKATYVFGKLLRTDQEGNEIRIKPRYPPEQWNHFLDVVNGDAKTNNFIEGYNHRLKHLMGDAKSIYAFFSLLRKEECFTRHKLSCALAGKPVHCVRRSTEAKQVYLQNLARTIEGRTFRDYIHGVASWVPIPHVIAGDEEEEES